jgi:hypothetical protein
MEKYDGRYSYHPSLDKQPSVLPATRKLLSQLTPERLSLMTARELASAREQLKKFIVILDNYSKISGTD